MMNRIDRFSSSSSEAKLQYMDGDFRVLKPGAFVRCAVTGALIAVEDLRYWSVERQEPYANPQAVRQSLEKTR